jgi:hypothetical protein
MTDDAAIDEILNTAWKQKRYLVLYTWHGERSQRQVEGSVERF